MFEYPSDDRIIRRGFNPAGHQQSKEKACQPNLVYTLDASSYSEIKDSDRCQPLLTPGTRAPGAVMNQ